MIKITPFQTSNVPPPMALHETSVMTNAIDIAVNWDASLVAVLHQQGISIFDWKSVAASGSAPALTGNYTFEKVHHSTYTYQQISFSDNSEVWVLQQLKQSSIVKHYGFNDTSGRLEEIPFSSSPISTICTLSSFVTGGSSKAFIQGESGDLHTFGSSGQPFAQGRFPAQLPWVEIIPHGNDHIAFGMANSGYLYANSRLLVKNCTSFLVTPSHLICTTTTHLLKFVHIASVQGLWDLFYI